MSERPTQQSPHFLDSGQAVAAWESLVGGISASHPGRVARSQAGQDYRGMLILPCAPGIQEVPNCGPLLGTVGVCLSKKGCSRVEVPPTAYVNFGHRWHDPWHYPSHAALRELVRFRDAAERIADEHGFQAVPANLDPNSFTLGEVADGPGIVAWVRSLVDGILAIQPVPEVYW